MKELLITMGMKVGMTQEDVLDLIARFGEQNAYTEIKNREPKTNTVAKLAINGLIAMADEANPIADGDYYKDGLLYCGKCNTPKQARIVINGIERHPGKMCACMEAVVEANEERIRRQAFLDRVKRNREMGFPDSEMRHMTFERDDGANPKLMEIARNYVQNFDAIRECRKNGLLFFGTVGTGKTFASTCIANALVDEGRTCLVTNFSRVVNTLESTHDKQDYIDGLNDFDLLVIDDLASERNTEYMDEHVFSVIDGRVRSGKPMIVTTNLSGAELKNASNIRKARIYSRLMEVCLPYEVKGNDRRRESFRTEEFAELKRMLGA